MRYNITRRLASNTLRLPMSPASAHPLRVLPTALLHRQSAWVLVDPCSVEIQLPAADVEVVPGVRWGAVEAFPTPAYWAYQALARRFLGATIQHRLGRGLDEELAACLLGGHGIPAEVGLAAFARVRDAGAVRRTVTEGEILELLSEPLAVRGRRVRYRFAGQKARYLARSLQLLGEGDGEVPTGSGRVLRDWLTRLPGVGFKTASWVARNHLDADDVAILDIHILRAGDLGGFLDGRLSVERNYLELEAQFLRFCQGLGIRPAELDSVIWTEMKASTRSVERLLRHRGGASS